MELIASGKLTQINSVLSCNGQAVHIALEDFAMTNTPSHAAYLGPDYPHWKAILTDGAEVLIRPIGPQDAAAEKAFIESLSPATRRNRFLGQIAHPSDALIHQLTDIDYINDVALVAVVPEGAETRIVGVSRYAVDASREACECAVVVADAWQGKGLGTALMERLIGLASGRGLLSMNSVDSAENWEMRDLATALGFHSSLDPSDPHQVIHTISLVANETPVAALPSDQT